MTTHVRQRPHACDVDPGTIRRFRRGDPDALAEIYRHYARAVWTVIMRVLRDQMLTEDATTETFVRAWRSADSFNQDRALAPWLFTIARRTAIDVHRREFRPTRGDHAPETDVAIEPPGVEDAWMAWEVRRALADLPDDERVALYLSHFEQLTHGEIATRLEIPLGTVKSRTHRAHRRLAERLRHLHDVLS